MENHKLNLLNRCRLCGSKIKFSKGYLEAKNACIYKEIFTVCMKVNLEQDDPDVHPTKLCSKCNMKLYHLSKKSDYSTCNLSYEVFNFTSHADHCYVCLCSKGGRPSKSSVAFSSKPLPVIEEVAAKYGFLTNNINGVHYSICELFKSEVKISKTVHCQPDSKWMLSLFGQIIQPKPECLVDLPEYLNDDTCETIFSRVSKTMICGWQYRLSKSC